MKNLFLQLKSKTKAGFAMLFTVLIVSIMLAIALGISDLTFKQTILSSLANDSQLAFYQADSGVECGMYWDTLGNKQFPRDTSVAEATPQITCGDNTLSKDAVDSSLNYLVYKENVSDSNQPCFSVTFDKASDPVKDTVSSEGFSTCAATAEQVERGLSVTY